MPKAYGFVGSTARARRHAARPGASRGASRRRTGWSGSPPRRRVARRPRAGPCGRHWSGRPLPRRRAGRARWRHRWPTCKPVEVVRAQPHALQPVHAALEQLTPAQPEVQLQRLRQQGGHGVARFRAAVGVLEDGLDAVQLCRAAAVGAARQRLRDRSRSSAPPAWPMRRTSLCVVSKIRAPNMPSTSGSWKTRTPCGP